jgi:pSer/pThr/pTyr-binding forkhead associated (FHA) protein
VSREEAYEQAALNYRRAGYDLDAARCYRLAGAHRRAAEIYEAQGRYDEAARSFADAGLPELGAWLLVHHAGQPAAARTLLGAPGDESSGALQPPGEPWPWLRIGWDGYGSTWNVRAGTVSTIGRNPAATLTLSDPHVAWHQATVRTEGSTWLFQDAGSRNASWLADTGQRVTRVEIPVEGGIRLGHPDDGPLLNFEYSTADPPTVWRKMTRPRSLRRRLVLARCEIAEGEPGETIRPVMADVCAALADKSVRSDQVAEEWAVALSEAASRYGQAALVFAAAVRGGRYGAAHRWQSWSVRVLGTEIILPPTAA